MRAIVVGAGRMGGFHRKVLRDLGLDVSTVDPDPVAGADHLSIPAYVKPEVVCVATPMEHLAEQAANWAGFSGWLLVEKPGAVTVEDACELARTLEDQRVAVGYVERFNPQARRLRDRLMDAPPPSTAYFRRWSPRPSSNVPLDLTSHDVDLARWFGLECPVIYGSCANHVLKRRDATVGVLHADLTAHDTSPLHAQWHAFLSDRPCATLEDATVVLEELTEKVAA